MTDFGDLRTLKSYVDDEPEYLAMLDLQLHLTEFNRKFNRKLSLVMPKRGKRDSIVIGKAADNNHLLYQELLDGILAKCPKPLTIEGIQQRLIDMGEKPSTARMVSHAYFHLIARVLDPQTKLHRGASQSLLQTGGL